ncbi:hypothetical protein ACJX0J_026712, partial [Zea mays]
GCEILDTIELIYIKSIIKDIHGLIICEDILITVLSGLVPRTVRIRLSSLLTRSGIFSKLLKTGKNETYIIPFPSSDPQPMRMILQHFLFYVVQPCILISPRIYDTFDIGFITTDEFGNADILEATYPAVAKRLHGDWIQDPAIPVVTGFLGKGWKSGAVTTLGRGGSDLTATTIGKALGLREIQVWKDVDGVLTCDPNIYPHAKTVPYLTFEEATELAYFGAQVLHPQSMRPAREGDIPVRVKNSYNPKAPGTLIMLKSNVTMLDIVSTRMLGQYGFLARVFAIFEDLCISVDCVATSEVSVSVSLDPSKIWSRELIQQELDHVVEELEKIAIVRLLQQRAIISLIGNTGHSQHLSSKETKLSKICFIVLMMVYKTHDPMLYETILLRKIAWTFFLNYIKHAGML